MGAKGNRPLAFTVNEESSLEYPFFNRECRKELIVKTNCSLTAFICAGLLVCACIAGMVGCTNSQDGSASSEKVSATAVQADNITLIDADDVANLEDGTYLVDARTAEEYAEGHIPGALNASYPKSTGGPCQADENAASFRNAWSKLGIPTDAKVVLYCRTSNRSSAAASALTEDGYTDLYVYEGGWTDWSSDPSRPVEK